MSSFPIRELFILIIMLEETWKLDIVSLMGYGCSHLHPGSGEAETGRLHWPRTRDVLHIEFQVSSGFRVTISLQTKQNNTINKQKQPQSNKQNKIVWQRNLTCFIYKQYLWKLKHLCLWGKRKEKNRFFL